jgi:hypothetical protein
MNEELKRMHDLSIGEHWIADPSLMLFCILTNVQAKDVYKARAEFKGIPGSYVEAAKLLYKGVGNSNADELKSPGGYDMAGERICDACLQYLATVMTSAELEQFKTTTPIRTFKSVMADIRAMLDEE